MKVISGRSGKLHTQFGRPQVGSAQGAQDAPATSIMPRGMASRCNEEEALWEKATFNGNGAVTAARQGHHQRSEPCQSRIQALGGPW